MESFEDNACVEGQAGHTLQIYSDPTDLISPFLAGKYEREAARYWDRFYSRNGSNFFKNRHYLEAEFPQLNRNGISLLEVGCGAGNTVYPLLQQHPDMKIWCCDFSKEAVQLVKTHAEYDPARVTAFVADVTQEMAFAAVLQPGVIDVATLIFVLSAISPDRMSKVVQNLFRVLKPGGQVLLRDYAEGDLAQMRLAQPGKQRRICDKFYVRGDGTRAFYFSERELRLVFENEGFSCLSMEVHDRQIANRKKVQVMDRRWIQAVFKRSDCEDLTQQRPVLDASIVRFTGAAGRLTSEDRIRRSWLPDSLDPADVTAAELSPASNRNVADYEAQLEREFALVVGLGTGVSEDATPDAWEDVTRTSAFGLVPNIGRAAGLIAHAPSRSFAFDHVALHFHPDTFKSLHNEMKRQYFVASRFLFRAGGVWNKPDLVANQAVAELLHRIRGCLGQRGEERDIRDTRSICQLAEFVQSSRRLLSGKTVLELWCPELPACTLLSLQHCRHAVAAVKNLSQLSTVRSNIHLNSSKFIIERVASCHYKELASSNSKFDIIMSCWAAMSTSECQDAISLFLGVAAPLLSLESHARVVLSLIIQSNTHYDAIIHAVSKAGFVLVPDVSLPFQTEQPTNQTWILCLARNSN